MNQFVRFARAPSGNVGVVLFLGRLVLALLSGFVGICLASGNSTRKWMKISIFRIGLPILLLCLAYAGYVAMWSGVED